MKAEYISHMGDDLTVVNAARVSFDKESEFANDEWGHEDYDSEGYLDHMDKKLISYLARHGHWTPFSHPQITMRYTVPIFIARQEFKHIVGFTRNEVSRRYVDDTPELFTPTEWRKRPEGNVKQGSSHEVVEGKHHWSCTSDFNSIEERHEFHNNYCLKYYEDLIRIGVCPEQARMELPQSMYTSYYITGSLAAFARMVKQRSDPHAQVEIQELAAMVDEVIRPLYPVSWEAVVGVSNER